LSVINQVQIQPERALTRHCHWTHWEGSGKGGQSQRGKSSTRQNYN